MILFILAYLMHKAVQQYSGQLAYWYSYRNHAERWFRINNLTSTNFKLFRPAESQTYFHFNIFDLEDIEELFRTKGFVKYYDGLGEVERRNLYEDDSLPQLKSLSEALKKEFIQLNNKFGGDKKRAKRKMDKIQAYKDYIAFLEKEWKSEKPRFVKTYPDVIGYQPFGFLKSWFHTIRNLYQPIVLPFGAVLVSFLLALFLRGELTFVAGGVTVVIGVLLMVGQRIISYFLNRGFAKRVNTSAYGEPVRPDEI